MLIKLPQGLVRFSVLLLVTMVAEPGWCLSLADCEALSVLFNRVRLGFLIYQAQRANGHSGFLWGESKERPGLRVWLSW